MLFKEIFLKKYLDGKQKPEPDAAKSPKPKINHTKIISIINQKGGCGKTTTAINLSACLAEMQYKVLIIDLDPQANASLGLGINTETLKRHIYHVLRGSDFGIFDIICDTHDSFLKIVPSNTLLACSLVDFVNNIGREALLKEHTDKCKGKFDFIFIDCPPSLNLLTVNALTASNGIIIPIQTHYYSLEGMKELFKTIDQIKKCLNLELEIIGILATLFDKRTKLGTAMLGALKDYFKDRMFDTVVHMNSALSEAPVYGKPITVYKSASKGAHDYRELAREVLLRYESGREKEREKEGDTQSDIFDLQRPRIENRTRQL